jgi:PAS domain S-box-containing protein/putative nucleotidyltransferase with HDIG domain
MLRRLREAGIEPHWDRVQTEDALREALAGERWELALVDYNLPGFGGLNALAVLAAEAPDVPAITVSGAISEETAVATITAGAVDYVLKDNLTRLAPAVRRAVEGAELRRQQRRAAEQARQTMYAIEHSSQAIVYVSEGGVVLYVNEAAQRLGGVPPAEAVGRKIWSWTPMIDEQRWGELWRAAAQHPIVDVETTVRLPGGEERLISATLDHHERDEDSLVIVYARDITEQREVEERAQASEEHYRQLFESASDAVFVVAIDTSQIIDANNMASALYGYEHDELLTKKSTDLSAEPEATQRRTHEAQTKPGQVLTIPLRLHRKRDGTVFPVEITARNTAWGKQQVILVACRDITERRQAEEEIRRMALAVDTAPNSITVYDFDGRFLYANQRTFELHGYSRDEFLALNLRQLDVPAAEGLVAARMQELRERGEASFEAAHFRKDGTSLPVDVRVKVTTWGGKEAILSVATDLTERKQAEENLACLNQQNELILRSAAEGILGLDSQGNHTFVNPAAARMLGYAAEELLGRPSHSAWHHTKPDGSPYPREECAIYAAYRDGAVHRASTEVFWRKDGTSFPVEYASTPIYEQGRLAGAVVTFADITDRKQAEEELRLSQQRLSLHVEQTPLAVIEFDLEGRVREWNPAAAAVFGYSREAAIGQYWTFIVPAAIHGQLEGVWAAIVGQRGGNRSTNENITKDGQKISCEWFSTPLVGPGGRTIGVASLIQDVTEQVEAQEEVRRQAEQLRRTVEGAVLAMSHVVETRDPYTAGHERRVAELATAIAEDMGMDGEELTALRLGGLIHDIGKIAVPAEILAKPGRLSEVEFNLIKQHPASGFDILEVIDFGRPVAEIVLQHHERLDGSGYPRGLSGEDILPEARILAVADVVEAMSSHRPYRAALGMEAALAEIREHAGVKYDADVVAACVRLVEEQGFQFTP